MFYRLTFSRYTAINCLLISYQYLDCLFLFALISKMSINYLISYRRCLSTTTVNYLIISKLSKDCPIFCLQRTGESHGRSFEERGFPSSVEENGDFLGTGEGRGGARRGIIPQSERINPPSSWFPLVPLSFLSSLGLASWHQLFSGLQQRCDLT